MKVALTRAALLVSVLLCGCAHRHKPQVQPLAPPVVDTPPRKPDNAPINLPPPVITIPSPPPPVVTNTPPPQQKQPAKRHKGRITEQPTTQEAVNTPAPAPEVNAAGQFSTGGDTSNTREETTNSIAETERRLNEINRKLSDQEEKTSAQIREFLKQAKTALNSGDVDGAQTLAQKAKVLLGELTQ